MVVAGWARVHPLASKARSKRMPLMMARHSLVLSLCACAATAGSVLASSQPAAVEVSLSCQKTCEAAGHCAVGVDTGCDRQPTCSMGCAIAAVPGVTLEECVAECQTVRARTVRVTQFVSNGRNKRLSVCVCVCE
jgi:hypothetical protein